MPWNVESVMDQRIEFVLRAVRGESTFSRLCEEFGVSRPTGYLWLNRYKATGTVMGLAEISKRPMSNPKKTPEWLELKVEELRISYGWGARKIHVLLAKQGHDLPEVTINRILKRRGLVSTDRISNPSKRRFERSRCNELMQLDFKGEYRLESGVCYPLSLIDDCSRYLVGLWPLPGQKAEMVRYSLESAFREMGVPESLLMDHGTPWWSNTNGHGLTWLSVWMIKQGIQLIYSGIRHPQTQGKVERFHRTLKERTSHQGEPETLDAWKDWGVRFRQEYNELRPHEALDMQVPADEYHVDKRRLYQENPLEWDYCGARTKKLNPQGCINYDGRRYFVCEALAGEWVRVDDLDGLLLVTFRDTTVREIDLRTGRTRSVVLPSRANGI